MATKYLYKQQPLTTEAEVEAAITATVDILENRPSEWCIVKELGGNAEDGWVIPQQPLTDYEILNLLDDTKFYSVQSRYQGGNETGLNPTQAREKIDEYRLGYCQFWEVDTITKMYDVTSVDMSGYMS